MIAGTQLEQSVYSPSPQEALSYRQGLLSAINHCSYTNREALTRYCTRTYGKFPSELEGTDLFAMYRLACNILSNDRLLGVSMPVFGDQAA